MKKVNFSKVLFSGVIATLVMTGVMFMAPMMGMPKMNIAKMLGSMMGGSEILGWIAHFMIGVVLAYIYAALFYNKFSKSGWMNGLIYSILPWLMAQVIVMPMMMAMKGMSFMSGLFSGSLIMAMGSLIGHMFYGAVLGATYKNS